MRLKKLIVAGIGLALAASMTACGTDTPPAQTGSSGTDGPVVIDYSKDVGIVLSDASQPRWKMAEAQFLAAMPGAQVKFSNNEIAVEKTNVDSFIAAGVKVIIINSIDGPAAASEVEAAHTAGIPVIAYDRLIMNTANLPYYVTFDSVAVGRAQGKHLADAATTPGSNLYIFAGDVGDNNAFLFFEGAWSQLQPKIADGTFNVVNSPAAVKYKDQATLTREQMNEIMSPLTTLWDPTRAKTLAEAALAGASDAQKGTVYVLAPNDQTSCSMTDAFRADKAVTQIYSTGQDLAKSSVQYILDGKQTMTVFKPDKFLVAQSKSLADSIIKGEKVDASLVVTTYNNGSIDVPSTKAEITVVTKDNIEQVVNESGLYTITNGVVEDKK